MEHFLKWMNLEVMMGNLLTKTRVKSLSVFFPVDSLLSPKAWLGLFQVMSLSPAPLSLLIKAAPILTEEMYGDIQPAAWELLLSVDEHMAGAAGEAAKPLGGLHNSQHFAAL